MLSVFESILPLEGRVDSLLAREMRLFMSSFISVRGSSSWEGSRESVCVCVVMGIVPGDFPSRVHTFL